MPLTKIEAENFTVFENIKIPFGKGLNVLVGENGVGKTHIMKVAYAACQASKHDVSFSQKKSIFLYTKMRMKKYNVKPQKNLNYWNIIRLWIQFANFTEKKSGEK